MNAPNANFFIYIETVLNKAYEPAIRNTQKSSDIKKN